MPNEHVVGRGSAERICPCGCGATLADIADAMRRGRAAVGLDPFMGLDPSVRRPGEYFPNRFTRLGTELRAVERGMGIEVAPLDVLQIDIDGPEAYERFETQLNIWQTCPTLPALGKIVERASRTAGHKHITIELPTEYSVEQRVMMQALLGSDLKRELLSLASHHNGHENPIVFYRPQEEVNAVTQTGPRDGAARSGSARNEIASAGQELSGVREGEGRRGNAGDRLRETVARRRPRRSDYTPQYLTDDLGEGIGPNLDPIF